jgi:hypothetical protein
MWTWIQGLGRRVPSSPPIRRPAPQCHLTVERLDNRCLPSATSAFQQTNLVSDQPGGGQLDGAALRSLGTVPGNQPNFRGGIFVG